ncbi:Lysozyme 1-like protein, partial [Dinothrombium tinctorium]
GHSTVYITQECLDCICYASTGCDTTKGCHNAGPNSYFCGPFQISWAYWADAGKPGGTGAPHDFEKCLNSKKCAEQTVAGYMQKWAVDCNKDGVINCLDFAAIHKFGPNQCSTKSLLSTEYWNRFKETRCYSTHSSGITWPSRTISWTVYPSPNNSVYRPNVLKPLNVATSSFSAFKPVSRPSNTNPSNSLFISGEEPVSDNCLSCICEASSGCDLSQKCDSSFCGPYLISWAYWADGGKPGGDYVSCALNKKCAERAIQGYMSKWLSDCNSDGIIDCDDFAAIHKLGPTSCSSKSLFSSKYWRQYEQCSNPGTDPRQPHASNNAAIPYEPSSVERPSRPLRPTHNVIIESNNDAGVYFPNSFELPTPTLKPITIHVTHAIPQPFRPEQPAFNPSGSRQPNYENRPRAPPPRSVETHSTSRPSPTSPPRINPAIPARPDPHLVRPLIRPDPPRIQPSAAYPDSTRPPTNLVRPILNTPAPSPSRREPRINVNRNSVVIADDCLSCICEASSKCDENIGCSVALETKICGPYQISFEYWTEAGRPGYRGSGGDFENCANDKVCAGDCIRGYINKWASDCNGDGVIDCLDFAAIHKVGPQRCNNQQFLQSHYWSEFQQCYGFSKK